MLNLCKYLGNYFGVKSFLITFALDNTKSKRRNSAPIIANGEIKQVQKNERQNHQKSH
jgi:hypothetical protein